MPTLAQLQKKVEKALKKRCRKKEKLTSLRDQVMAMKAEARAAHQEFEVALAEYEEAGGGSKDEYGWSKGLTE